ncbi:MAG: sulfite exporter TauE/SafE family protein [Gammaproteobacteria bacterium]|nr:sulfite exporter TauE/SafE family protein [Gammaproteobacteria bacterium]
MEVIAATLVVLAGSYVQTAIGFGLAVIAAPVLFFINPDYVPAPITISALTLSIANAWRFRRSISSSGLKFAIIGRVPGTVAGGLLVFWIDQRALGLWLGLSVLAAVWLSLGRVEFKPTRPAMFGAGFLSGFMGTSTSIGGPPMALVLQHQSVDFIRANMAAFFVVSCVLSLAMLGFVDRFGPRHMLLSLPFLPATLLGYWLAMRTAHRISADNLRTASLSLCALAGLAAVVSYWL